MEFKFFLYVLAFSTFLTGCSNYSENDLSSKEMVMLHAKNYQGLISLYTSDFPNKSSPEFHYKLGKAYQLSGDPESAMFHFSLIPHDQNSIPDLFYWKAKSLYDLGSYVLAQENIENAIKNGSATGEAFNMSGLIYAENTNYALAKNAFENARIAGFDNSSVKNNLAMIDILERRYEAAINKLTPIYSMNKKDSRITGNILLAYAKKNDFDKFKAILLEQGISSGAADLYAELGGGNNKVNSALKIESHHNNSDAQNKFLINNISFSNGLEYDLIKFNFVGDEPTYDSFLMREKGKWVLDIKGSGRFSVPHRKKFSGRVTEVEFGQHKEFVRIVFKYNQQQGIPKPKVHFHDKTLSVEWIQ